MDSRAHTDALRRLLEERVSDVAALVSQLSDEDLDACFQATRVQRRQEQQRGDPRDPAAFSSSLAKTSIVTEVMEFLYAATQLREQGGAVQVVPPNQV